MSLVSLPYPNLVNGTVADGSQVTSNFTALLNGINGGIDTTNIGPAGIDASKLVAAAAVLASPPNAGSLPLIAGVTFKWGTIPNVAWDGSAATPVTFTSLTPNIGAFSSVNFGVILQPLNDTGYLLAYSPSASSTTGFTINVTGAPPGTTGSVFWISFGI